MFDYEKNGLLKFVTCGSVDDGKSTLLGHMLYSAKKVYTDQIQSVELESKATYSNGKIDYSLFLDGLEAEREQGITIDVCYRYFNTNNRSFIVADCPGHMEYTRNMAVGASFADVALLLVDITKGLLPQTIKHYQICKQMGINDFIFAVNKIDLVKYSFESFITVQREIEQLVTGFHSLYIIPVSAVFGDNLNENSTETPWYTNSPLIRVLEEINPLHLENEGFCMPVQRVCRANSDFRGYQGEIISGNIITGDEIIALPSKERVHIKRIIKAGMDVDTAFLGDPVTICIDRDVDISRGSILTTRKHHLGCSFAAKLLWLQNDISVSSSYRLQIGTQSVSAFLEASRLSANEFINCKITTGLPVIYDIYDVFPHLGRFILIDRLTNQTVACGFIEYPLNEEGKAITQNITVTRTQREQSNGHRAITLWMTGLSGAGKSTIADLLEQKLYQKGVHTLILDGDNIRLGLCKDLGFSLKDRKENIRRVAETARLLNDAGVIVIAAFISPLRDDREMARQIIGHSFREIYVKATIETCIKRDVKGIYKKALRREIREFTGISSPYEPPLHPEIIIDTDEEIEKCVEKIYQQVIKEIF